MTQSCYSEEIGRGSRIDHHGIFGPEVCREIFLETRNALAKHNVVLLGSAGRVWQDAEEQAADPNPFTSVPTPAPPEPGHLSYLEESARAVRVTALTYRHEWVYIHDPDQGSSL